MKYSVAGIRVNVRDVNASNREWNEILTKSKSRLHVVT